MVRRLKTRSGVPKARTHKHDVTRHQSHTDATLWPLSETASPDHGVIKSKVGMVKWVNKGKQG